LIREELGIGGKLEWFDRGKLEWFDRGKLEWFDRGKLEWFDKRMMYQGKIDIKMAEGLGNRRFKRSECLWIWVSGYQFYSY
jgi:hypothetical protein